MKLRTWEMDIFDFDQVCANPLAKVHPNFLQKLIFAENENEARDAFYLISEPVGENGSIYPVALPVLKIVLASLPYCSTPAKWECLQLVSTIVSSEGAPGYEFLKMECANEVKNMFWYFVSGLQFDATENISVYVDILGILGTRFSSLKRIVISYIELALTREVSDNDKCMFRNTVEFLNNSK